MQLVLQGVRSISNIYIYSTKNSVGIFSLF